jgi:hypothetical protein
MEEPRGAIVARRDVSFAEFSNLKKFAGSLPNFKKIRLLILSNSIILRPLLWLASCAFFDPGKQKDDF